MHTDSTIPLPKSITASRAALLNWYDNSARELPWRLPPTQYRLGKRPDPYGVWLSEIMLQQTSVTVVKDYYLAFIRSWPTITHLANASLEDVLSQWAGLGYYARARNLHACAQSIAGHYDETFPQTETELRALPGIGDYTAAAIMAIAYRQPANVVDGNVERIMARLHQINTPLPQAKKHLKDLSLHYVTKDRAADWPQALMDLGALVCRPKNPNCPACPLQRYCKASVLDDPASLPRRVPKAARPLRFGATFVLQQGQKVWLRRRPPKGLLGGMSEVPGTKWAEKKEPTNTHMQEAPVPANWQPQGMIHHVFTHFSLELAVYWAQAPNTCQAKDGWWADISALDDEALPSVMRKVLAAGLKNH